MSNVGDVIAIYRCEEKNRSGPSGIGVVVKVYNEDRCFVKLLRNYSIPESKLQNWKKFGITDKSGYYVRLEDHVKFMHSTFKTTYTVSPVPAFASKVTTRSCGGPESYGGYTKRYPKTITEVYCFDMFSEIVPRFIMMRDISSEMEVWSQIVTEKYTSESFNDIARRAYALMQISKFERFSK